MKQNPKRPTAVASRALAQAFARWALAAQPARRKAFQIQVLSVWPMSSKRGDQSVSSKLNSFGPSLTSHSKGVVWGDEYLVGNSGLGAEA